MADYRLSEAADRDISEIARYTLETWGEAQTDRYRLGMQRAFERISRNPKLGISSENIRPGTFRYRYQRHVVFYKPTREGILIIRVLHTQMDYIRHL